MTRPSQTIRKRIEEHFGWGKTAGRSAAACTSARPHAAGGVGPRRRTSLQPAVEFRLGEKRAGQLQDLVGTTKLAILTFQLLDALGLGGGHIFALPCITLVLTPPVQQRLRRAADLAGDLYERRPLRFVLPSVLQHPMRTARSRTSGENFTVPARRAVCRSLGIKKAALCVTGVEFQQPAISHCSNPGPSLISAREALSSSAPEQRWKAPHLPAGWPV